MKKRIILVTQLILFLMHSLIICQKDSKKESNIYKMNKILRDSTEEEKVFDLLFVIDVTGYMLEYIRVAIDETENISKELQ